MSAEEILNEHLIGVNKERLNQHFDFKPSVLRAMESYAQQQADLQSVEFARWLAFEGYWESPNGTVRSWVNENETKDKRYTIHELLTKFKESKP